MIAAWDLYHEHNYVSFCIFLQHISRQFTKKLEDREVFLGQYMYTQHGHS